MSFMGRPLMLSAPRHPGLVPHPGLSAAPVIQAPVMNASPPRLMPNPRGPHVAAAAAAAQQVQQHLQQQAAFQHAAAPNHAHIHFQAAQQPQPPPPHVLPPGAIPNGAVFAGSPFMKKRKVDESGSPDPVYVSRSQGMEISAQPPPPDQQPEQQVVYQSGPEAVITKRKFLSILGNSRVYQTEEWSSKQSPLYRPITDDILINTRHLEQVSFAEGSFFIADGSGNYSGTQPGDTINLWRFDSTHKKLYVSRSLLFLDKQMYIDIRRQLEAL